MEFTFTRDQLKSIDSSVKREWSLTNGIGGYAGGSITGALSRTHQGYLIASLHPPVDRYMVFAKTNEEIIREGQSISLGFDVHAGKELQTKTVTSDQVPEEYKKTDTVNVASDFVPRESLYSSDNSSLDAFIYDGVVTFLYKLSDMTIKKEITLVRGQNTCAIAYTVENTGAEASLKVTPFLNYRDHSYNSSPSDLVFHSKELPQGFHFTPKKNPHVTIELLSSQGRWTKNEIPYEKDIQLPIEVELETPGLETHYTPLTLTLSIPAESKLTFSLTCSLLQNDKLPNYLINKTRETANEEPADCHSDWASITDQTSFTAIHNHRAYIASLLEKADYKDPLARELTVASDAFLSYRSSTGLTTVLAGLPWFTDWGRDTMIAFTGLTLSTRRFDMAREILETFSKYIHHGMVPNMFPDNGQAPLYNTVDASLWYFYAVYQYLNYDQSKEAQSFVKEKIYPALVQIIEAYQKGTDFSIYMEEDGLIHAGSGVDQVTWMDVRVGNWVVTPRHGKPVEINALWYNALCIMTWLESKLNLNPDDRYEKLASKVKASFQEQFWNPKTSCLYDVIDKDEKDPAIRPNQIYAISLPYSILDKDKEAAILETVQRELYVGIGLRSLSRDHKDYHPVYCGSLPKRDAAYHQGTAWGFLLGGFLTAYMKIHGHTPEAAAKANELLNPIRAHLKEGGIGSISEIFDGDAPHRERGCYAQAWSVGEVLRAYTTDILPYLS